MSPATILLVDDNSDVREITALLLRSSGHNVIEAASASAALGLLDANPTVDLLILDFAMPRMSGIELLARARAKRPEIRAVFITGYGEQVRLREQFDGELITKPFMIEQLELAIRKTLGQAE
jgi:CheY-like chemotaxis protein